MSSVLWKSLVVSPAILAATLLMSVAAMAASKPTASKVASFKLQPGTQQTSKSSLFASTSKFQIAENQETSGQQEQLNVNDLQQVNKYSNEGKKDNDSLSQVTSVSQFSDVQPTDWAFQALQSLVERYGCIAGYPNGTFRGNRAMTRYEFAAGLNACLNRINELIATSTADLVKKEDLATLQRLQEEFTAELSTLRGRVDALEARTAELEANQFSTTTKLAGEAIFALSDNFGKRAGDRNNAVFQDRVRLDLQTSFTGKDILHTRLAAGNGRLFDNGTRNIGPRAGYNAGPEGIQTFQTNGGGANSNNNVNLDWLAYYAPVGPARVYVATTGGIHSDYAATVNPYFEDYDGGNGALSSFASENPIFRIGGGAGGAVNFNFGKGGGIISPSSLTVGYLASTPNDPRLGNGVFNGNYAALGQLNFNLGNRIALAATYVHGYDKTGSALFDAGGQLLGNDALGRPIGIVGSDQANEIEGPSATNSYGLSAAFRPSDKLSISGFVSYSSVVPTNGRSVNNQGIDGKYEAWSYGAGVALPDFGKRGNVLGLFAGAEPYALNRRGFTDSRGHIGSQIPYHIEGFYKYRVSDNVSITPGVIWLINPQQNSSNPDAIVGTLRTTFTF